MPLDLGDPKSQLSFRMKNREAAKIAHDQHVCQESIAKAKVARSRPLKTAQFGQLVYFYKRFPPQPRGKKANHRSEGCFIGPAIVVGMQGESSVWLTWKQVFLSGFGTCPRYCF